MENFITFQKTDTKNKTARLYASYDRSGGMFFAMFEDEEQVSSIPLDNTEVRGLINFLERMIE